MFRGLEEALHRCTGETALYIDKLGGRNFSVVGFSCNLVHKSHPQGRVQYNTMFPPTSKDGTKKKHFQGIPHTALSCQKDPRTERASETLL